MATLQIEGIGRVQVDDSFRSLSPEQQESTIAEIMASRGPQGLARQAAAAVSPITNYPAAYGEFRREAQEQMGSGVSRIASAVSPSDRPRIGPFPDEQAAKVLTGAGELAAGALGYVGSPINAALRTVVGQPIQNITGVPKEYSEFAAGLALPLPRRLPTGTPRPAAPPTQQMGVTLSTGQATGDLSAIQREQAALRGTSGPKAQEAAQAFADQQRAEVATTREGVARKLDPGGQVIAERPQEAAALAQQSVQQTAAMRKADVGAAYETARAKPGEIHAAAFEGLPQKIKGDLTLASEPVIIDNTTPFASKAIKYLEDQIGNLQIKNRADPFGQPDPSRIVGVDLKGVDQWRKNLSTIRSDAFRSGNAADGRAAQAVLRSFDDQIDAAVKGGMFTGDESAIKAWDAARAAHADYKATFGGRGKDPVGNVVQKIIGSSEKQTIPNDVADFLFSSSGVNPNSLNVAVTNRIKGILGEQSPEWAGVRQGLFSKLVDAGEGMTQFGGGKVAQRLNDFLSGRGKEMAALVFSPAERAMLQQYADLMRKLEVPQAGANWSNTATFTNRALDAVGGRITAAIGAVIGHGAGIVVGVPFVGEAVGAGALSLAKGAGTARSQAKEAANIARQMPVIANTLRDFGKAAKDYEISQTARNVARVTLATRNLTSNLQTIGIALSPDDLWGGAKTE